MYVTKPFKILRLECHFIQKYQKYDSHFSNCHKMPVPSMINILLFTKIGKPEKRTCKNCGGYKSQSSKVNSSHPIFSSFDCSDDNPEADVACYDHLLFVYPQKPVLRPTTCTIVSESAKQQHKAFHFTSYSGSLLQISCIFLMEAWGKQTCRFHLKCCQESLRVKQRRSLG